MTTPSSPGPRPPAPGTWPPSTEGTSALLARAVDRTTDDPAFTIARLSVDMLGPIAQGVVRTEAEVVRPGRRVSRSSPGCSRTTCWPARRPPGGCASRPSRRGTWSSQPAELPPIPETGVTTYFEGVPPEWGYGPSVEWRFVNGGFDGPATGRARLQDPPEDPAGGRRGHLPLHRLMVVADSTNGVSARLPIREWWSIPTTLTVTVERVPTEEWMWMDAVTDISPPAAGSPRDDVRPRRRACARRATPVGQQALQSV